MTDWKMMNKKLNEASKVLWNSDHVIKNWAGRCGFCIMAEFEMYMWKTDELWLLDSLVDLLNPFQRICLFCPLYGTVCGSENSDYRRFTKAFQQTASLTQKFQEVTEKWEEEIKEVRFLRKEVRF